MGIQIDHNIWSRCESKEIRESPLLCAARLQVHQEFRVIPESPLDSSLSFIPLECWEGISEANNLNYLNKRARMGHISARNTYWKELEYDNLLHYLGIFMSIDIFSRIGAWLKNSKTSGPHFSKKYEFLVATSKNHV